MGININEKNKNKINTNYNKYHLLCYIVMTSTQNLAHTLHKLHNRNNENQALL